MAKFNMKKRVFFFFEKMVNYFYIKAYSLLIMNLKGNYMLNEYVKYKTLN